MSDNTEKVIDVAADVAGEMAQKIEGLEQTIRTLNRTKVQFYFLGMAMGGVTGAFIAYKVAYKRIETKYSKIVDEEVADMKRHYEEKRRALEAESAKNNDLGSIVAERGYTEANEEKPPMAIQPPQRVTEANLNAEEATKTPPVPVDPPRSKNIFQEVPPVDHTWDWHEERRMRSPDAPYVIHVDEKYEMEDYDQVTLTYYDGDDVLCRDDDSIIDPDYERNKMIGDANLARFGHGSEDPSIVYIRNDSLEIIFEVIKTPHKYAEEVHGFHHGTSAYRNVERMRIRERDEQED